MSDTVCRHIAISGVGGMKTAVTTVFNTTTFKLSIHKVLVFLIVTYIT